MRHNDEAILHTSIVKRFRNYGGYKGEIIAGLSEILSTTWGNKARSLGLRDSIPDLTYLSGEPYKGHFGIELKTIGSSHNVQHLINQAEFLIKYYDGGYFVDSEEDFSHLLECIDVGKFPPSNAYEVLGNCKILQIKNVKWDKVRSEIEWSR